MINYNLQKKKKNDSEKRININEYKNYFQYLLISFFEIFILRTT